MYKYIMTSTKTNLTNTWNIASDIIDYSELNNDTTIKGKYKLCFPHHNLDGVGPGDGYSSVSMQILAFFSQYTINNNIEFHMNFNDGSFEEYVSKNDNTEEDFLYKEWRDLDDDSPKQTHFHRLPDFLYKNLECEYKGHKCWISNIPFSDKQISHCKVIKSILIVSHDIEDRNKVYEIIVDIKNWTQQNICAIETRKSYNKIYTWTDGYWELKKGNRMRSKDTLFLDEIKYESILKKINCFSTKKMREIYKRLNIPYKLNILLYGPPGTGKSSFIEVVASLLKRRLRFMQITPKLSDDDFTNALSRLGNRDILICEDIDCLFVDRKDSDSKKNSMTFSGLLNCFDGINASKNGLLIFMTTNYKCNLDKALTRPGRIDISQEFSYMNRPEIEKMIKCYFEDNFNQNDFDKFANHISNENITGAIMSNFLLQLIMNDDYNLMKNKKLMRTILNENDYETTSSISKALYS